MTHRRERDKIRHCTQSTQRELVVAVIESRRLERSRPAQKIRSTQLVSTTQPHPTNADGLRQLADADLLLLISRRALHALEVIYDRHIQAAWRVALTYSDDVPAAERAVAAAFLHLWRQPEPGARSSLAARLLSSVKREALRASLEPEGRGIVEPPKAFAHERR